MTQNKQNVVFLRAAIELCLGAPELLAEVLVEEAVDDGVCAGGGHAEDVADGVDAAEDLLRHRVRQRRGVPQRVQDVQRQPADAEDRADPLGGRGDVVSGL